MLQSAAKIDFVMLAFTACTAFLLRMLEAKDFMFLTGMAFTFYFSAPQSTGDMGIQGK